MGKTVSKTDASVALDHRKIMSDAQQHVQDAIDQLVESGTERGIQVAVYWPLLEVSR